MVFSQTFDLFDIPRVFTLAFLEILLSADNAIVLGLLARSLAPELRRKAFIIGGFSALVLRAIALLSANVILQYAWLQGVGAAYLFYLSFRHFTGQDKQSALSATVGAGFWKTVILIELFDLAFAVDSIVAGVAFISSIPSQTYIHPKLWIVYVGAILGLACVRYAAKLFTDWVDRFPRLEKAAYMMIAWIGVKLGLSAITPFWGIPDWFDKGFEPVFWIVLGLLFLSGFTRKKKTS